MKIKNSSKMCVLNCTENQASLNSTLTESCEVLSESLTSVKCIKTFAYSLIMLISLSGNFSCNGNRLEKQIDVDNDKFSDR